MKLLVMTKDKATEWVVGQYALAEKFRVAGLADAAAQAEIEAKALANLRDAMAEVDIDEMRRREPAYDMTFPHPQGYNQALDDLLARIKGAA